jgi:transcription initiation factor IIF auxiliary subunit
MSLSIAQEFAYQDNDLWKWSVWIEGSGQELDEIDHVVYTLHRSFPDPVRTVADRGSQFRLSASGWGVFRIYGKVVKKDGEQALLHHDLVLEYPDGRATTA